MPAVARIDPKDVFAPEEWARFSARSSWLGLVLVAGAWGLIFAAGAMFVLWPNLLTYVLAVMLIGARQLGLAILMHDAAHGALHSNMKVNNWVGEWLCAAPVGARLASYREYHLKHHRFTEQPEDPDLALSAPFPITRASLWRKVVRDLTGQTFSKQRGAQLFGGRKPGEVVNSSTSHFLLTNAILFGGLALAGYWWAYPALWLVPMATWLPLVTRLRNIAEHAVVNTKDDPFTHARTTLANAIERLFIAPYWVHFHGEHHVFMHVPCYRLERMHRSLMDKGYWSRMRIAPGYAAVLGEASSKPVVQLA
ncbi:fatty acid desaturase family protein [Terricaulis silvestris]|uniref:Fatty acid desaturase n=1 Tax=Terricaulis silvestris TaxID=2686094 RepID=A0A6I6MHR6_9CAUL|nr:fatty acid desaturase family protein [Terricaulis silvestris]QGZ94505.1 Fatty acid desaturase [Terricaulis silvestris]